MPSHAKDEDHGRAKNVAQEQVIADHFNSNCVYDIYEIIKQDLHSNQTVLHVGGSLKPHTWLLCEVKQAQALKIY